MHQIHINTPIVFYGEEAGNGALLKMLEERRNQRIRIAETMKKKKKEEDRISALPDCLLLEILSRLPSTKDTIRTGTLSKRWEHLWTWVSTLIFKRGYFKNRSDFCLFVDKTLSQCRQLKLKKFEMFTSYDIRFESQFRNWIRFAISCNVEELNLEFLGGNYGFVLDQFFINSCFTDLRLEGFKLNPTGAICWENLRSFCFLGVRLDEDLLVNILSGSPLLQTLELSCYLNWSCGTTSLSLTQCPQLKKLKKLVLDTTCDIQSHTKINNLIHYAIRCNVTKLNVRLRAIDFKYESMKDQILFTSSCFTELTLEGCMHNPVGAISWKSLRFLCISDYRNLDEDLIENILCGSPVLETLKLDCCYGYRRLDITSKSVKNLVLYGLEHVLKINAPNILSLTIYSGNFSCKPLLLNVSSLVKAYLNYNCTEEKKEMLKGLLMNLGYVKELELGFFCAKTLSCLQAQGFVSPSNVKVTGRMF